MRKYLIEALLIAALWGVIFPKFTFTSDVVKVTNESGEDVTEEEMEKANNLYYDIGNADETQIEIKSKLLEWIGEK